MRKYLSRQRLLTLLGALLLPSLAFAQGSGGAAISSIFEGIITVMFPIWTVVALLAIIIAGFTLMISQDEGKLDTARKTIIAVVIGGIIITILWVIGPTSAVNIIYNSGPARGWMALRNTADALGAEAEGVASWVATIAAMIGILIIIIAVLRAVTSFGSDESAYNNVRTALLHIVLGFLVIAAAYIIRDVLFFIHEPSPLLAIIAGWLNFILGFIALIAVAILIYAGFRMVASFGREEDYSAAKSLAIRVITGLFVICISFVLVNAVVLLFNSPGRT